MPTCPACPLERRTRIADDRQYVRHKPGNASPSRPREILRRVKAACAFARSVPQFEQNASSSSTSSSHSGHSSHRRRRRRRLRVNLFWRPVVSIGTPVLATVTVAPDASSFLVTFIQRRIGTSIRLHSRLRVAPARFPHSGFCATAQLDPTFESPLNIFCCPVFFAAGRARPHTRCCASGCSFHALASAASSPMPSRFAILRAFLPRPPRRFRRVSSPTSKSL